MKSFICLFVLLSFFTLSVFGQDAEDKIVLKDGTEVVGKILKDTDKYVKIKTKYGVRKYSKDDISNVVAGGGGKSGGAEEGGGEEEGGGDGKITKPVKIDQTTEIEGKMQLSLTKMRTQHFVLMCEFDEDVTAEYLNLWEKVYADFCVFWKVDPDLHFSRPCQITIFSSQETYRRYVDKFVIREQMSDAERELYRQTGGLHGQLSYTSFKDEERMPSHEDFKPRTLHSIGHILLNEYKQVKGDLPTWLNEGWGSYCEFKYFKKAGASCVNSGSKTGRTLDEGWEHGEDWHDLLKETLENEELANFSIILNIDLNAMTFRELAHAWSMTTFLIETYPDKFRAMMDAFKERGKKEQIAILREVFQWSTKDFEKEWHKYLKRRR